MLVNEWSKVNTGISIIILKTNVNQGPAGARNLGVAKASGKWLAFLDADDEWLPDKLLIQKQLIESNPNVVMLCGKVGQIADRQDNADPVIHELTLEDFALANPVATSTVVLKKEVFATVGGFDESFRGPEDYDLWMRVGRYGKILFVERQLAIYGEAPDRLSFDDRYFLPQVKKVIRKAYGKNGVFSVLQKGDNFQKKRMTVFAMRKAMAWQYLSATWAAAERGAVGRAIMLFIMSLLWWPFSFKPERELAWGRCKIVVFITRSIVSRINKVLG